MIVVNYKDCKRNYMNLYYLTFKTIISKNQIMINKKYSLYMLLEELENLILLNVCIIKFIKKQKRLFMNILNF